MGFAPPPHDGFALIASAHADALGRKHIPRALAMNAPYTAAKPHAIRLGSFPPHIWDDAPVLGTTPRRGEGEPS
jgi:hypothetical protein